MSNDVILLEVANKISLPVSSLFLQLLFIMSLRFIESIRKELHVRSGSSYILFDFLLNYVVEEVLIPDGFVFNTQWMIILVVSIIVLRIFHVWNDNKVLL